MTRVRIPPALRSEVGGAREVPAAGRSVRELLDDLMARFPALRPQLVEDDEIARFVNVYLDGEDVRTLHGLDTPVDEGATVILLPAMAGGSPVPLGGGGSHRAKPGSADRLTPLAAG
jgi:sulfur-carrier protein